MIIYYLQIMMDIGYFHSKLKYKIAKNPTCSHPTPAEKSCNGRLDVTTTGAQELA
jgi:hypothetical protein